MSNRRGFVATLIVIVIALILGLIAWQLSTNPALQTTLSSLIGPRTPSGSDTIQIASTSPVNTPPPPPLNTSAPKNPPSFPEAPRPTTYAITYFTLAYAGSSLKSSPNIAPDKKSVIEKTLSSAKFSPRFVNHLAIIISPAQKAGLDVATINWQGAYLKVLPLSSGVELGFANYRGNYILLSDTLTADSLSSTLMHEMGHLLSWATTPEEFKQFMQLRQMDPVLIDSWYQYETARHAGSQSDMPLNISIWNKSPEEDFAECFKSAFRQGNSANWQMQTSYGPLTAAQSTYFHSQIAPKFE